MMQTKSLVPKLVLLTLIVSCLTVSVNAAKISKTHTKSVSKTAEEVTTVKSAQAAETKVDNDVTKAAPIEDDADEYEDEAEDDYDVADDDDGNGNDLLDDGSEKNAAEASNDNSLGVWSVVSGIWNWIRDDISAEFFAGQDDDDTTTSAIADGRAENGREVQARTFGKIRRLQMALIPIIFKFGILTAMVAFLVAIAMKTLFLIKVLLVINVFALLGKFFTLKADLFHTGHSSQPSWGWSPPPHVEYSAYSAPPSWAWGPPPSASSWPSAPVLEHKIEKVPEQIHQSNPGQPSKEIHLHIHGGQGEAKVDAFSTYGPATPSGWKRSDSNRPFETLALSDHGEIKLDATRTRSFPDAAPSNHRMF
ncbi:uncharacterized protein LOC106084833 [Stomoxys calcitrans]|uniref:uncharacterized protein LOC106084833 n=1 Tax=Stomoxys calcitrans TaxID=35570 RepID=UPI0027E2ADEA|nr:uncharacterized protein LOC106084833 [Stomoxys calcitrans]